MLRIISGWGYLVQSLHRSQSVANVRLIPIFLGTAALCLLLIVALETTYRRIAYQQMHLSRSRLRFRKGGAVIVLRMGSYLLLIAGPLLLWLLFERPIMGLGCLLLAPPISSAALAYLKAHRQRELEDSALSFFQALEGLIQAGLPFPSAVFQLSQNLRAPFSEMLRPFTKRYERGQSLRHCLTHFRLVGELRSSGLSLSLLEMAYESGLQMAPLLKRILPYLEAEMRHRERAADARHSALAQILFSLFLPWGITWVLHTFQPKMVEHFYQHPSFIPLCLFCLLWEGLGCVFIWRGSCFC